MNEPRIRYDVFAGPEHEQPDPQEPFISILTQIEGMVAAHGDRVAVADVSRSITYQQLWEVTAGIARTLRDRGCEQGDRIALDLKNSVDWVEALIGVLRAGGVAVPLDPRASEQQRSFVMEHSQARWTLAEGSITAATDHFAAALDGEDLGLLLYTSGTTGAPKGVMISHANLACYRSITQSYFERDLTDDPLCNLIVVPLCHSAGCNTQLLPTLASGGTAVIAPGSGPTSVLSALRKWNPDSMFAVPVIYRRLLDATGDDPGPLMSLRDVHFGAAVTPATLIRDLRAVLPHARLGNAFGMTEISNVALFLPDGHLESSAGSVGFPVAGVECRILDPDSEGRGELLLRGPNTAVGYWRRPDLTTQVFSDGWVRSGDIAEVGSDGAVYLRDRVDDVINRGGEKIYSTAVEDALLELEGVCEATVVGVPDEQLGARVAAVLVTDVDLDPAQVRQALRGRLAPAQIPEIFTVQSAPLPRGNSGKVNKREVETLLPRSVPGASDNR